MRRSRTLRIGLVLLAVAALYAVEHFTQGRGEAPSGRVPPSGAAAARGDDAVLEAFRAGASGVDVEVAGTVAKVLRDDREGSRHQRFILRLDSDHTLLVTHNIDLAPRVEGLSPGDRVELRGQYEWNERGGVVHWTHHDPQRRRPGGWIRHEARTYR